MVRRDTSGTDSCGCAMGARFAAAALLAGGPYELWRLHAGNASRIGALAGVLVLTLVTAGAGKVFGILQHRRRHGRTTPPPAGLPQFRGPLRGPTRPPLHFR